MALPTIVGTPTENNCGGTASTNVQAAMPAGIQAGDLILVVMCRDTQLGIGSGANGFSPITGNDGGAAGSYGIGWYYKVADGGETGTITITTIVSDRWGTNCYVLRGWGALPEEGAWSTPGSSVSPNPPSLTPSWGSADVIWIEAAAIDAQGRTLTPSSGYGNTIQPPASGTGGLSMATARKTSTASSEDPAAVTWSSTAAVSSAMVLGIRGPVTKSAAETGAGAEATTTETVSHLRAETGAGAEGTSTVTQIQLLSASDSGSGADTVLTLGVALSPSESASGAEGLGSRTLSAAETATGVDASHLTIITIAPSPFPILPLTLSEALRRHHTPVVRLTFLQADLETVTHEVEARALAGSVDMDRARNTHRSAQVQLANDSGLYTPASSESLVWPNRLVRIERGAVIGTTPQYAELITGVLDGWSIKEHSGVTAFTVWSRLHLADQQFPIPITFQPGVSIEAVIRELGEVAGLGISDSLYVLDGGGQTLADARTYDTDDNILTAMVKLAFDSGLDLYDDGHGRTVLRPFPDPATAPIRWEFEPGQFSVLVEAERSGQALAVYNRAVVVGASADRYPIRAEARVTNPTDPLYNPEDGSGPVGDRPRPPYVSSDITTQSAANAVAARLLVEGALYDERVAGAAVPIPLLRDRDVVRFTAAGTADRYLLDKVTIPLGKGQMQLSSRRIRTLTTAELGGGNFVIASHPESSPSD
jgi:hypothetical protein